MTEQLAFHDGQGHVVASLENPYPVQVVGGSGEGSASTVVIRRDLRKFGPTAIPGIALADAFDANDQMGTALIFTGVPPKGTITEMTFHDLDDEGINKMVYVFRAAPTLAASDAAFALGDMDNLNLVGIFSFTTWRDNANNQVGFTTNTPCDYVMNPTDSAFYIAVQTLGADNIAAGAVPEISLIVEVAQ